MRVDKTDLDDSVVEDGEATTIVITDGKSLTTKNRDVNKSAHPLNGVHVPNGCSLSSKPLHRQPNGVVAMAKKQREPVEDCEEEEEGEVKEPCGEDALDSLTHSMKGVSIQETTSTEIEGRLANLTVKDNEEEEEDDTRCASLQSQSSIITVDPPSLTQGEEEEEEERGGEKPGEEEEGGAEYLASRGPTAGKPSSYRPNHDNFNRIAGKSYSSHNLDRFHSQAVASAPFVPGPTPTGGGPAFLPLDQSSFYPPSAVYNLGGVASGKRGMEDEEDTPFKYTRPVEEMPVPDCTQPSKNRGFFSQVSVDLNCGGNVVDTSLSPEEELARSIKTEGSGNIGYGPQLSITDLDNMLETFNQMEQVGGVGRDHDPGYYSENSPPSDHAGSPGSSPKSVFSPPNRPPSNMSQDSGIASPFSEDSLSTIVPSPPEDSSQNRTWADSAQPALYQSPPGGTMYQGPPSVTMSPPGASLYHSPASVTSATSPSSMAMYPSPPSVASVMSPYSIAGSDDLSMTSVPSPATINPDSQNDYMFNMRKEELRDALDVIAQDVKNMTERKRAMAAHKSMAPATTTTTTTTNHNNNSSSSPCPGNLPVSVTQQRNGRPEKLPIAPLQKSVRPAASGAHQQQQQQSPMMKGALPVMVLPNTMAVAPVTTTAASVAANPVLLMKPGQNPMIVVVNGNNQQAAAQTPKKKLQKILPRPGPAISDSAPKAGCAVKPAPKADLPAVAKQEPSVVSSGGVAAGVNGVRPSPPIQPSPAPASAPAGKRVAQGRNPPQSKMLNIARRLVASMTTQDLQFQDSEGDTYLHVSVCKADGNMVQALLERMSRENLQTMINTQNLMRQTPLYLAVSANSPEMVALLIQYGADVNVFAEHTRADGRTKEVKAALHCAASHGQSYLPTLQALLAAKELNIDLVNSDGHTALHCAILEHGKVGVEGGIINNLPIIQVLIKHGADPNAQGKKSGKTALMYALESRDLSLIEHIVALIDPARLRIYLKSQAFDGSTCQRIMESLQRLLDDSSRQRLHACFRISSKS
ncbi:uncharacterized protein LOC143291592 isoform X2 [Babylonia areolata]|uniref:uncharacterized protein LOC143291592 isoform X2 n=1 Tax=Babylonia areolata TaxID=304850 RepID=UPI003FD3D7AD